MKRNNFRPSSTAIDGRSSFEHMKKFPLTLILIFCQILSYGQDYYSNNKSITAGDITYSVCSYFECNPAFNFISLENNQNVIFIEEPFDRAQNRYCTRFDEKPFVYFPDESSVKALIKQTLLEDRYETQYFLSSVTLWCAYNPDTALIEEVKYELVPHGNCKIYSISPERFAELEKKLVGQNLGTKIPDRYKNMTYCICGVVCSFK